MTQGIELVRTSPEQVFLALWTGFKRWRSPTRTCTEPHREPPVWTGSSSNRCLRCYATISPSRDGRTVKIGDVDDRTVMTDDVGQVAYCNTSCCINRSYTGSQGWRSYGLTGLPLIRADGVALIRADGAQPSLHLDEYVRARTVYIWPCGPLR